MAFEAKSCMKQKILLWFILSLVILSSSWAVQDSNIVVNYELNESSGALIDTISSYNLNNMTAPSGYNALLSNDNIGHKFNLTPSLYNGSSSFNIGSGKMTISVTYQINETNFFSGWQCLVCKINGSSASFFDTSFAIMVNPAFNNTHFEVKSENNQQAFIYTDLFSGSEQSNRSRVFNVIGTYDGTMAKVYRDGNLRDIATLSVSTLTMTESPLTMGARDFSANNGFNGIIDKVTIWNVSLTEEEVASLFIPQANVSLNQSAVILELGKCPDTTEKITMYAIFMLVTLFFLYIAFKFDSIILGLGSGILLLVLSYYTFDCIIVFNAVLSTIAVLIIVFFALYLLIKPRNLIKRY